MKYTTKQADGRGGRMIQILVGALVVIALVAMIASVGLRSASRASDTVDSVNERQNVYSVLDAEIGE